MLFKGPLPSRTFGLIIGRSSNYRKNFEVIPGVIDEDSLAGIKIMIRPLKETVQLHKGQRVAQMLLLPYLKVPNPVFVKNRGSSQFGSSDVIAWVQDINSQRPFRTVKINGKPLQGLLDTGADKTCIAGKDWPSSWPSQKTTC